MLKLLNKEQIKADKDMLNFYIEAMKNIFKTWLKVEPNNTERIKQYIDELLSNNKLKSINEFEEEIYIIKQQLAYTEIKQYLKKQKIFQR